MTRTHLVARLAPRAAASEGNMKVRRVASRAPAIACKCTTRTLRAASLDPRAAASKNLRAAAWRGTWKGLTCFTGPGPRAGTQGGTTRSCFTSLAQRAAAWRWSMRTRRVGDGTDLSSCESRLKSSSPERHDRVSSRREVCSNSNDPEREDKDPRPKSRSRSRSLKRDSSKNDDKRASKRRLGGKNGRGPCSSLKKSRKSGCRSGHNLKGSKTCSIKD
mmetsp:Transcript_46449/g.98519  ORF Transcript_46449/g.98519 Transcript_46449/m.98519 type:complete len:218 (-) Transcript_46449:939-1592(-)